jgi:hypothetical protein
MALAFSFCQRVLLFLRSFFAYPMLRFPFLKLV